jgi:hypothetical protein
MTGYPNLTPFADPHDPEGAEVRSQLLTGSRRHIRTEFLACLNQTERSSVCLNIPCIIRTRSHERNHARGCCRKRAPALRLLPALAGVATIILAGQLARELEGRRWAMFLASLAALMAPVLLALSHLFTMNAFALPLPCRYR